MNTYIIVLDEKIVGQELYFVSTGEFSTEQNDAKQMSFDEAERQNIKLQLSGNKNWIRSNYDGS